MGTGESSRFPCQVFQFKVYATMPGQTILLLLLLLLMVLTYELFLFLPLFWFSTSICLCVHFGQWHTGEARDNCQASSSIMWVWALNPDVKLGSKRLVCLTILPVLSLRHGLSLF